MNRAILALSLAVVLAFSLQAQERRGGKKGGGPSYPPAMEGSREVVYKTVGDTKLKLYVYAPANGRNSRASPAIVFFFGGGWKTGSPAQFEQHCRYLASRGMVAIAADYRVASRNPVKPVDCVGDAKSAIRWVRAHAEELRIDPERIAAAGGSAGGHLAAATATLPGLDDPNDDSKVSAVPNALVLFNPAVVLAPLDGQSFAKEAVVRERAGIDPQAISPAHHVRAGLPPTIIFHGRSDKTVPYASVEAFTDRMTRAGNRCELIGYDGQEHGFFNLKRGNNRYFVETLEKTDSFLVSLGWLKGEPQVVKFFRGNNSP